MQIDFKNLDDYYEYLENDSDFKCLDLNTYKYIAALRDEIEDESIKKICSYELCFINFTIQNSASLSQNQLELFDDDFDYIKSRAAKVKNSKYKAKYNHFLWLSPQRNIAFAKQAIDSYLNLLKKSSFSIDENLLCYSFGKYFKNLIVLSQKINYKKEEVITYLVSLLESEKLNDFTKYSLMEFIIENGKNIDGSIKQTFFDYSINKIENLTDRELESYLNLLILLSHKLNLSPNEFHEKLGDYHISQLENEKNKGFIAHLYYSNALEEYRKANNKDKIEQTAVLLEKAKKNIDLKKVSVELEDERFNMLLNEWWNSIKEKITQLIENRNHKDIYDYLILEKLFPKAAILEEEIKPATLDFISTMAFDINHNISRSNSSGVKPYFVHMDNFSLRHIHLVFIKGMKNGKISFESLIDYLKNESWYGQDFTYLDTNSDLQGFNWIELLSPSLQSFFVQTEIDSKSKSHNPQGYILAIDSLVLKFEGLLREFSRMIGAQTIEIKENGTEERVGFDKLLDNQKLTDLISEDDIAYFKFLFTSKGLNIRNNIAHCFYTTKNYSPSIMLLLIVALLRLGNYRAQD